MSIKSGLRIGNQIQEAIDFYSCANYTGFAQCVSHRCDALVNGTD